MRTAQRSRHPVAETELTLGRKHRPDYWLMIWGLTLMVIGIVVLYAISPALAQTNHVSNNYYLIKQLIAVFLSFIAFYATYKIPLKLWRTYYKPLLIFAGLATLIALAMPVNPAYPAHRWVRLGGFSFQSVEIVKFAGLIWLASFLAKRIRQGAIDQFHKTLKPLLYVLIGVGVIIVGIQSDLGSAGVIVVMLFTMAYVAGLPLKRIGLIALIGAIGLILAVSSTPYRRQRLEAFLHPQSNCQGSGYQACQALIAVGSGGFLGLGLGSSVQAYGYLPEADNDSIFAIYAEKFGFVGSTILIIIFAVFFTRIKNIAERLPDDFSRLLVIGILTWLSVQALINIGAMIGLLPLKGITLPFISYGGTSIVFTTAAVGLVFQASQYTSIKPREVTVDTSSGRRSSGSYSSRRLGRVDY
ncbi:MAG TPA: putative peptidoglycan glycosyltransferase FtsW [Candidatus Saccharimonadales bacterium]|nr:putative peptidoglycan glycosyltransferase FtsW [Candidatus Saccharimonadales bacterium]